MMRSVLLCLLLAAACSRPPSAGSPLRSPEPGPAALVSVEPVRITEGFDVWRNGKQVTIQDGLLIRLDGVDGNAFVPRATSSSVFVLGDTIGDVLDMPLFEGKALLLVAAPPPETEVPLWLSYQDVLPTRLTMPSEPERQRAELVARGHGWLDIRTPPADAPRATYATRNHLLLAVTNRRFSPELCAMVDLECGVSFKTQFGVADCGPCPAGKVCTANNRCAPE